MNRPKLHIHKSRYPLTRRPWIVTVDGRQLGRGHDTFKDALLKINNIIRMRKIDRVLLEASEVPDEWHGLDERLITGDNHKNKYTCLHKIAQQRGLRIKSWYEPDPDGGFFYIHKVAGEFRDTGRLSGTRTRS